MPRHVVVDGSNLATEGRAMPSLKQLNDAVVAFMEEHPGDTITVVVDATFGHRIPPSEVAEFDAAIENNELVSPPAGAIGRGDKFVIEIAKKVGATILSNDSYQEFHGEEPWLFDEGRLIGGKPVPHVGWVFVPRTPVRGPISRKAVKAKKGGGKLRETRHGHRPTPLANQPMPQPKAPPPRSAPAPTPAPAHAQAPTPSRHEPVNELLPFLAFVEAHPVGSVVDGIVESYSSHGAYARAGEVRIYCPMRHMASPPPRAAREVLKLGEALPFEVVSFNAARRSVDVAVPGFAPPAVDTAGGTEVLVEAVAEAGRAAPSGKRRRGRGRGAEAPAPEVEAGSPGGGPAEAAPTAAPEASPAEPVAPAAKAAKRTRKAPAAKAAAPAAPVEPVAEPEAPAAPARKARKAPAKKAAAPAAPAPPDVEPPAAPARKARKAPAKKAAAVPEPEAPAAAPVGTKAAAPAKKAARTRTRAAASPA